MKTKSYYLVSLGCAKNSVDSQSMATLLEEDGYSQMDKPSQARLLIVNTCGFIASAREESISVLTELATAKKPGQMLIAAGCLPDRVREQLTNEIRDMIGQSPVVDQAIDQHFPELLDPAARANLKLAGVPYPE